jgi:hypothetical protein
MDRRPVLAALVLAAAATGCASGPSKISPDTVAYEAPAPAPAPPPAPLDRSLFAPIGSSRLSEAEIGRILDAPIDMRLPSRVGVAALGAAFTPGAPATLEEGVAAARVLSEALENTGYVTVASEVSPQLPTGGGVEGLRELAARYRSPYLLLYTERFEDRTEMNGWGALWPTVIGGLLSPNRTLEGQGVLEASLLDIRSGTLLFTVQEQVHFREKHLPFGAETAWKELRRDTAAEGAKKLAARVVEKWQRTAKAEQRRIEERAAEVAPKAPPPVTTAIHES